MGRNNLPIKKYDWIKFEETNLTIALNVSHAKKEKMYPVYVSKSNSRFEKQVLDLIFPNDEGWSIILQEKSY